MKAKLRWGPALLLCPVAVLAFACQYGPVVNQAIILLRALLNGR